MKKVLLLIFFAVGIAWIFFVAGIAPRRYLPAGSEWPPSQDGMSLFDISGITDIRYFRDGTHFAIASTSGLWFYDSANDKTPKLFATDGLIPLSVSFSPDGETLAVGCADGVARLYDIDTGVPKTAFIAEHGKWRNISFKDRLTSLTDDNYTDNYTRFFDVFFNSDGTTLITWDIYNFNLWDIPTNTHQKGFDTLSRYSVSTSANGINADTGLLAIKWDVSVHLFDIRTGEITKTFEGHTERIQTTAISPDGRMLASGGSDETVRLWDIATGEHTKTLKGHQGDINNLTFSPDGRMLASVSDDDTVRLWDTETGKREKTLIGHLAAVYGAVFSPDGGTIISWSNDRTIRLWDVETGKYKKAVPYPRPPETHQNIGQY